MALSDRGDENIVEAVVVIVTNRSAESIERNGEARLGSHVCERAVVIVVIELLSGGAVLRVTGPILSVYEQYVGPALIVLVNERAAWSHGFRKPFFPECAVVVGEADAGLRCDVGEGNSLRA